MSSLREFILGFGTLALLASAAFAQGSGGGPTPGMLTPSPLVLFVNPDVQKELKFTEAQINQAPLAMKKLAEANRQEAQALDNAQALRQADPAPRAAFHKKTDEQAIKALALNEAQVKRFRQIVLQILKNAAFMDQEVLSKLKTTDEQRKQIQEVFRGWRETRRAIINVTEDNPSQMSLQLQILQRQTYSKLESLLTDEQKTLWKEMTGEPFDMALAPVPN